MEIEAKFRIDDPRAFALLLSRSTLGDFALRRAAAPEEQRNTYYDTSDGRLRAASHGLRIREVGNRRVATLKGKAQVQDSIHQRGEWEVPADSPDPATWPASEARERALALTGGAPLLPLLTIATTRHIISAYAQDAHAPEAARACAEICLDEGTFYAGARSAPFRELEVELLPDGTRAHLDALIAALHSCVLLIPEARSKLQQALELQQHT